MNDKTVTLIAKMVREASRADKKTTEERFMKLMEEVGEASRAWLEYNNAPGMQKSAEIIEVARELADVTLCVYDLVNYLAIGEHSFENLLFVKAKRWQLRATGELKNESGS